MFWVFQQITTLCICMSRRVTRKTVRMSVGMEHFKNYGKDVEIMTEEKEQNVVVEEEKEQDAKKYTDEEVDRIINRKFAELEQRKNQEIEDLKTQIKEADKLRQMDEEQKLEYEREQAQTRIEELEAQVNRHAMEQEATKILAEKNIVASTELLDLVIRDDAEGTSKAIEAFVNVVDEKVKEGVESALKGRTPTKMDSGSQGVSQEEFNNMSYYERLELKQQSPALYDELRKG